MNKIIIIGTGNIGKRHLQAVSSLKTDMEIICHDQFKPSLESVTDFCKDNNIPTNNIKTEEKFDKVLSKIDISTIVIVATTAKGRKNILANIIPLKPLAIVAEKPVVQTKEEYNKLLSLNKEHKVPVYVDFSDHMFPGYQKIYERVKNSNHLSIHASFEADAGLACNGIHYIEFISWLTDMKEYEIVNSELYKTFDSKREGFHDFTGRIDLLVNKKHLCSVHVEGEKSTNSMQIIADKELFVVFEVEQKYFVKDKDGKFSVEEFTVPYTSQITDKVVDDIINGNKPKLPLMEDVFLAHKVLFDFMKKHAIDNLSIT